MSPEDSIGAGGLNARERSSLLVLARAAIDGKLNGPDRLRRVLERVETSPGLQVRRGLFVSLHERSAGAARLRGCIGEMESSDPLTATVVRVAPRAATEDPRFAPITAEELPRVRISLSVLQPMIEIDGPSDIVIGRDGVQLVSGDRRSVFLPQVAREQHWGLDELLARLALKAGLPTDGWREARLFRFGAEGFGETSG